MGERLTAAERREVEALRDRLARRMEELEDQVSFGTLSDAKRRSILSQEFGADYQESLSRMNGLLHASRREPRRHPVLALTFGLVLLLSGAAFLSGSGVTGASVLETRTLDMGVLLVDGGTARLPMQHRILLRNVSARYAGPGTFRLFLEDGLGRHEIMRGDAGNEMCTGCGDRYDPPYLLELSGPGSLTIEGVEYR